MLQRSENTKKPRNKLSDWHVLLAHSVLDWRSVLNLGNELWVFN